MTPFEIEMMLHFHYSSVRHPNRCAPAYIEAVRYMFENELIETLNEDERDYGLTDRGRAYVEALCAMPLPVCKWVIPREGE